MRKKMDPKTAIIRMYIVVYCQNKAGLKKMLEIFEFHADP